VADAIAVPGAGRRDFEIHQVALIALGIVTTLALIFLAPAWSLVILEVAGATVLYASTVRLTRSTTNRLRIQLLASYAFAVWFYCAVARITPALGMELRDGTLLAIDQTLFGQTPAVFSQSAAAPWLTDLLSLCYLAYLLYLPSVVIHAALLANAASRRLGIYLFTGFAMGFAGYLLVPAVGPAFAFPELFRGPIPEGAVSRVVTKLIAAGSSGYDVFPSLHALITCILLDHDWRHARRRFWIMIGPALGMLLSTIYLRYHYGVDVIAGLLMFVALRQTFLKVEARTIAP